MAITFPGMTKNPFAGLKEGLMSAVGGWIQGQQKQQQQESMGLVGEVLRTLPEGATPQQAFTALSEKGLSPQLVQMGTELYARSQPAGAGLIKGGIRTDEEGKRFQILINKQTGQPISEIPLGREKPLEKVSLVSPEGKTVKARPGTKAYDRFLNQGYTETQIVSMSKATGGRTHTVPGIIKGSEQHKQLLEKGYVGGKITGAGSETQQLIELVNSIPKDDPSRRMYLARLQKLTESEGLSFEMDSEGNIRMLQGPQAGKTPSLTMKTRGAIEEKQLGSSEQIARIQEIRETFDPKYLEHLTKLKVWSLKQADKMGISLSDEDRKLLTDYSNFMQRAITNINLYIKEITGAQMSEREANRLRKGMPDPERDSPTQFLSKLENLEKMARAAQKRYEFYWKQGLSNSQIQGLVKRDGMKSLDSFVEPLPSMGKGGQSKTIDERGNELAKQGLSDAEVMKILKTEGYY